MGIVLFLINFKVLLNVFFEDFFELVGVLELVEVWIERRISIVFWVVKWIEEEGESLEMILRWVRIGWRMVRFFLFKVFFIIYLV